MPPYLLHSREDGSRLIWCAGRYLHPQDPAAAPWLALKPNRRLRAERIMSHLCRRMWRKHKSCTHGGPIDGALWSQYDGLHTAVARYLIAMYQLVQQDPCHPVVVAWRERLAQQVPLPDEADETDET